MGRDGEAPLGLGEEQRERWLRDGFFIASGFAGTDLCDRMPRLTGSIRRASSSSGVYIGRRSSRRRFSSGRFSFSYDVSNRVVLLMQILVELGVRSSVTQL